MATKAAHSRANHGKSSAATTTTAPVTRGKRKLNFSTSTSTTSSTAKSSDMYFFRGKKLFLDLPGYNKIDQIEYELTERGGTVERRFHSGVKYLITNRQKGGRGGSQVDSPSTPSPHTPSGGVSTRGGGGGMSKLSPSAESPGNVNPLTDAPGSRAALILAASQKGKRRSTDLRALAEGWGCKVLSLSELLKELRKLKPLPKKESPSKKAPVVKVRKLKPPFLKVEDESYSYRPLVYETRQWPHPDINCSPKGCPFEVTKHGKSHRRHASPKEGAVAGDGASSPEAAVAPPIEERRRPGYCECCSVRYRDLSLHLKSAKHLEYAHDDENFASLDKVIAKGTKFDDFVASVRAKYPRRCKTPPRRSSPRKTNSPYKTMVNLVTPPSPRPTKRAGKSPSSSSQSPPPCSSPPRASNPAAKAIVLDETGAFVSPKRGQLCLTPINKDSSKTRANCTPIFADVAMLKESGKGKEEYTPGFTTPPPQTPTSPGPSVSRKTNTTTLTRKKGGGSRVDPVTRALLQNTDRVNTRLRVQKEREIAGGSGGAGRNKTTPVKNGQHVRVDIGDGVPETPEKDAMGIQCRRKNRRSPLINFQSLVERIAAKADALSKAPRKQRFVLASDIKALVEEITRQSSSSPVHSSITPSASSPLSATSALSAVRKSPRLVERELQRFRPSVTTRTEKVMNCRSAAALIPPSSLMVSFDLNRIYPGRHKHRSAILAEQAIRTPKTINTTSRDREDESVTPEIEFQGDPSTLKRRSRRFSDRESPMSGGFRPSSWTSATAGNRHQFTEEQQFHGFSTDTIREALPTCNGVSTGGNNHLNRSPRSGSKVSVDSIAMRLAARKMLINDLADEERERLGRKRGLDQSDCDDSECEDPHLSPPPAKRRRVSFSEATPSPTPLERPNRRSPRLAMSRKLQSLLCN